MLELSEQPAVTVCRKHLALMRDNLKRVHGTSGQDHPRVAIQLIEGFAFDIDTLIITLWKSNNLHLIDDLSLVATGGYGRMELHPFSDIDLLILHKSKKLDTAVAEKISAFIRNIWDCELKVGSSIRSVSHIKSDVAQDLNLLTSVLESRQLTGNKTIHIELMDYVNCKVLNSPAFFRQKLLEQKNRHARFDNISYLLEPNIKSSPGALRDIHHILWLGRVHVRGRGIEKLLEDNFISHAGMHQFIRSRNFLTSVRLALHLHANKAEDRLLIDYQRNLASELGYKKTRKPAVEEFMQRVYKSMLVVSAINDTINTTLLKRFDKNQKSRVINSDFYAMGDTLMCNDIQCFQRDPGNLLLCFKLIAQNPSLKQLSGQCMNAVYENSLLIDDVFRYNPINKQYFLDILAAKCDVSVILEQMKRFGVLGRYLPVFGKIIGQLQHDFVHVFTVDTHTIQVLHKMYNLLQPQTKEDENLRIPCQVASQLPEFTLLLMAGLFHDIAKGRGGNHSELGAVEVETFARDHNLPDWQISMLSWLVEKHLAMSATSQQQDADNPEVIEKFAEVVGDKLHLDYLYLLTVTDIQSTNPGLWNSWRCALLTKLYQNTLMYLKEKESFSGKLVDMRMQSALIEIPSQSKEKVQSFWKDLPKEFFHSKSIDSIVLHSNMIARHFQRATDQIDVLIRPTHNLISLGATEVSVLCINTKWLFAQIAYSLHKCGCNVLESRVYSLEHNSRVYAIVSCILLGSDNKPIAKRGYAAIRKTLQEELNTPVKNDSLTNQILPSKLRKIWFVPYITISHLDDNSSQLRVESIDFPGLLALIAHVLQLFEINLTRAHVSTLGDRAVDTFVISDKDGVKINPALSKNLIDQMQQKLAQLAASRISA